MSTLRDIDSAERATPRRDGSSGARLLAVPLLLVGLAACAPLARYEASGELAGQAVATRVDTRAAAYYLESYLQDRTDDSDLDSRIAAALAASPSPHDRVQLEVLTQALSTDAATMYFVSKLYEEPDNRRLQDTFQSFVEELKTSPRDEIVADLERFRDYQIVFVPGYAYRSNPANGADFRRQRELLAELGFDPILIETEELGTVEVNAAIVTEALRELAREHDKIVLVSASKGGAELGLVLGALAGEPAVDHIQGWISVGGLLRGSPYADRYARGIKRWLARIMLKRRGQPPDIIENLSTLERRPAFEAVTLPSSVLMLHYVGAPLSGHVRDETRGRYEILRRLGPNDGLTLLADELTDDGLVVTEVGLDHYFRAPDIDIRTVALTYAIFEELARRQGQRSAAREAAYEPPSTSSTVGQTQ
ncbi:MAG TPA: hypothetical protein VLD39_14675 [Gammaproteobacteria bacterium]|nr:hypothetical protein [Gammaproteobacteria bacterium]